MGQQNRVGGSKSVFILPIFFIKHQYTFKSARRARNLENSRIQNKTSFKTLESHETLGSVALWKVH